MQINTKEKRDDVDLSAEGYLQAKLYLRTVFWQDMPFIHQICPDHPIFGTSIFRHNSRAWDRWKGMALQFAQNIEEIEHTYLRPPLPMMGANSGMQLSTCLNWIQEHIATVEAAHGFRDTTTMAEVKLK